MRTPFYKSRADAAAHYRRDGDFVQIKEVYPDDLLGPSYNVVRDADNTIIRGVRGPKHTRFAEGNTAFLRFMGGSHYYCQLEGVAGGSATTSLLSRLPEDFTGDDYVQRAGDTLSGTLAAPDNTLEVDFVDGLLVFRQAAGVSEQGGDLELSSAAAGKWGLSQLIHHGARHENGGADEINVGGLAGLLADAQTPLAHKTTHQDGGGDEINVGGLAGLLADSQTPLAHKISHQHGGSDEISLSGLVGQAGDPQKIAVRKNWEANAGVRPRLHLSEGANVTLSLYDNPADDEIIAIISAAGTGGGTSNHADLSNLAYADAGHTGFEPAIGAGLSTQYWRGDKSWQTFPGDTFPGGSDGQVQYNNGGSFGGDAALFWDDTNKRLGIGTNAPQNPLHIVADGAALRQRMDSYYAGTAGVGIISYQGRGSVASPSATQNGDGLFTIACLGYGATGVSSRVASIALTASENFTDSTCATNLYFYTTAPGSTSDALRVAINSLGITLSDAHNIITGTTTGMKMGTATNQKLGFWNATPVVQPAHIADPSGGKVIDAEARTAIAAINAMLAATGLTAAS